MAKTKEQLIHDMEHQAASYQKELDSTAETLHHPISLFEQKKKRIRSAV